MMTWRRTAAVPVSGFAFVRCLKHLLEFPVRHDAFGNVTACVDDRNRSSRFMDRRGCGGELLIIGLNRPQNFWAYLLFNGLACSPDGIFNRNRRTRSMSNDTDAI